MKGVLQPLKSFLILSTVRVADMIFQHFRRIPQYLPRTPQTLRKGLSWLLPEPQKSADGRDQWPSRAAFLLAAMGGCAGQGNLLRYPSVVYNNYGLQWFIPYLLAVFLIAIPALVLEISIGQAYRGGSVIAFNNINRRLKGVGLGPVFVSFVVVQYFTVNLAWIMNYFRNSFASPLPWENRIEDFYNNDVVANPDSIQGGLTNGGKDIASYTTYPAVALIGETVGWSAFIWFLIWFSIFRGVGLTGRVVYFTMGLPIVTTIIIVGRALSLDNAAAGVRLLWATWRGDQLASGTVWQTAVGQVFFSTGIGFGYFTSYASYNQKHSNAVMDAILICGSNVLFENFAAFAIFGIIAFICYELLFITSLRGFREWCYELFLACHVSLQIMALVFLWLHYRTAKPYVYACFAIFLVDRLVWRVGLNSAKFDASLTILDDGQTVPR